ncbi:MAG: isochorismatase family protein [Opitutales bacterium]|nr:isochorismatase family protein [Opitutales bacterium]
MQERSSVIVFMDMQSRLLNSIENADELIESCSILAACSKLIQIPSVLTEQVPEKLGSTDKQIVSQLDNPQIIIKDTFSAFGSSGFCDFLTQLNTKRIILVGIETPICIFLTALDALKAGFSVTLLSDCVSCRVPKDGKCGLSQLLQLGVEVIPLESFIFRELQHSAHPNFREISNLIKNRALNI